MLFPALNGIKSAILIFPAFPLISLTESIFTDFSLTTKNFFLTRPFPHMWQPRYCSMIEPKWVQNKILTWTNLLCRWSLGSPHNLPLPQRLCDITHTLPQRLYDKPKEHLHRRLYLHSFNEHPSDLKHYNLTCTSISLDCNRKSMSSNTPSPTMFLGETHQESYIPQGCTH